MMKFSDVVTTDEWFKPEDLKQLEESVLNPQLIEVTDVNKFLADLRERAEAAGVVYPDDNNT